MDRGALAMIIPLSFLGIYSRLIVLGHHVPVTSCHQTPYPQVCHHFIASKQILQYDHDKLSTLHIDQAENHLQFRDIILRATSNQAQEAHRMIISSMDDMKSPILMSDDQAKLAWTDCMELYEDTVTTLNQTTNANVNVHDVQIYLSAAIANQETCENGFNDLNLSIDYHLASINSHHFNNFSMLLSNALAVNWALMTTASSSSSTSSSSTIHGRRRLLQDSIPTWLSVADRKLLQKSAAAAPRADIVVAKDGSGNYETITEAIAAAKELQKGTERFVIYIKKGVYNENAEIKKTMKNLMLIGDGIEATIVTASKNVIDGFTTFRSATFAVSGDGFIAQYMTFENSAGPAKHQAVALRSGSDYSVFYRCRFVGYQDTLYVHSKRQFYRECEIYGTVDFIFGDAAAVIQNCNIYARKPMSNQMNTITAQGRKDPNENTGIVIHNSIVTAASDIRPVQGSFRTFLGRPWKQYSRTVIMKSVIDTLVDPQGWTPWSGAFALDTLYYGEYGNTGGGAGTEERVKWKGYHVITNPVEASEFTANNMLAGSSWIPSTGVPFTAGL